MRVLLLLCCLLPAVVLAQREPTVPPVYYLIDYGGDHLANPDYVTWAAELPPELLHFGKDVPMTHLYGPIAAVGGENQAHGRNRADIRRLTPAQVRERIAVLRRMNADLHAAGVTMTMPYIASITMAGEPVKREGFFDFYDHWNEYLEFGIGPRPQTAPETWVAVKADGSLHTFGSDLAPAYYAGMNRYVCCIEHPDWRNWLKQVTRLCAVAGYDGVFPDNSSPITCYAPYCQAGFRKFLAAKYRPEQLHALFNVNSAEEISLPKERDCLLWVEAQRFWQTSLARHLYEMRQAARTVNPKFLMFPNCGTPIQSADYLSGHADYMMLEGSGGPEGPGVQVKQIVQQITLRTMADNILDFRYIADVPGDLRAMLLKLGQTPAAQRLAIAEAAAFGSGAYNGVRKDTRESQRPYIEFLLKHKDLYEGKTSAAQVAVLYYPMQAYYPNGGHHLATAMQVKDRLGTMQVPFDCFSEMGLTAARLKTYRMVIVPQLMYLSEAHLKLLRDYAAGDGKLLLINDCGSHDDLMRERAIQPCPFTPAAVMRPTVPAPADMTTLLTSAGIQPLVSDSPNHQFLRVMTYESPGERLVHLVNYNCPIMARTGDAVPDENVRVQVPLPAGKRGAEVTVYSPEAGESKLQSEAKGGVCSFVVPEVGIYVVCRVRYR